MKKIYLLLALALYSAGVWAQCTATTSKTDVSCNGGSNGTATATPSGGVPPYTFSWAPGGQTTQTATGLTAGTYTVTVNDAAVCTFTTTVTIAEPAAALSVSTTTTNVTCMGGSNGTATATPAGGTSPYTYSWNSSPVQTTQTATGLAAGTYAVAVVDANGCTSSGAVTITQPTVAITASASVVNVSCNGMSDGSAMIMTTGATGPVTYMWSPITSTNDTVTGLAAGSYTATVTDSLGCMDTALAVITQPAVLAATVNVTNATCDNSCDGIATAMPTGGTMPYSYSWTNSATTQSDSSFCAGNHAVVITDVNGCTVNQIFTVTDPAPISVTTTSSNATCTGCSNGSATATAIGGTSPYTYLWTPGNQTTQTASGLAANTYVVCVSDANNCPSACDTVTITDPSSVAEIANLSSVTLAPNPVNDIIILNIDVQKGMDVLIKVTDMTGRVISAENVAFSAGNNSQVIAVDALPAGTYFVSLTAEGNALTRKFVKM